MTTSAANGERHHHEHYDGPERRGEDRDMEVLKARLDAIKETLDKVEHRLGVLEESSRTSCRDCTAWPRIAELEKQQERAKGMVIGISSLMGVLWTLASFVLSHLGNGK